MGLILKVLMMDVIMPQVRTLVQVTEVTVLLGSAMRARVRPKTVKR